MAVTNLDSKNVFEDFIKSSELSVIHFHAEWAEQCKPMDDVIEELSKQPETIKVHFARIHAEDHPEISLKYQITSVPTFILFRSSEIVDRLDGASPSELNNKINRQANISIPQKPKRDINEKLKELINAAPVMLFMKGNSKEPRCGFSKQIIALLDSINVDYKTFDILNDEEVRQELKKYSDWPTYPQLYVNGNLIGGIDIVNEMNESGNLESMLPKKKSLEERLKTLINQQKIMIFMKGDRTEPRCGFSRQLIEIFKEININDYETFDILKDEEVRQGLKTYSDWPTYPQIYVNGELIGGLDIIKELKSSGELLKTLNA